MFTHVVVLDFEATCEDGGAPDPQEIIEFPSVLLDAQTLEVVDEFESFVRPVRHPVLTPFCLELTGIEQADVDAAAPFEAVFDEHLAWLASHGLPLQGELPYVLATCGDWDLLTMLPAQLRVSQIGYVPHPYRRWVNVKRVFEQAHGRAGSMVSMLEALGLPLEGRHHRGIDDSRNIARMLAALVQKGQTLSPITELAPSRYPSVELTLVRNQKRHVVTLNKRAWPTLTGIASEAFRRSITRVEFAETGEALDADGLVELRSGTTLRVS